MHLCILLWRQESLSDWWKKSNVLWLAGEFKFESQIDQTYNLTYFLFILELTVSNYLPWQIILSKLTASFDGSVIAVFHLSF